MIGQKETLKFIDSLIKKGFPRFVIITGQKGQGKTELAIEISKRLGIPFCHFGIKVEEIREMIEMAYKQTEPLIYLIENADSMSIGAKNSLLKVIEEPPNNAYFIMELQQIQNTLDTIKSRSCEIKMQYYTEEELDEMIDKIVAISDSSERRVLKEVAQNYYQINQLVIYGIQPFYDFVDKVFENIYKVQSANSLKISEKIDLKNTGEGYDLELFWNMYIFRCIAELFDLMLYPGDEVSWSEAEIVGNCISVTEKYKQSLNITGINKRYAI